MVVVVSVLGCRSGGTSTEQDGSPPSPEDTASVPVTLQLHGNAMWALDQQMGFVAVVNGGELQQVEIPGLLLHR